MKKLTILLSTLLLASDEITIDSILKKQKGLRSITEFSILSSNTSRNFGVNPIYSYDDGVVAQTKRLSFKETFLYAYNSKVDLVLSFSGMYQNQDVITDTIKTDTTTEFSNLWVGFKYAFDKKIGDFKQEITLKTAVYEKNHYAENKSASNFKSYNIRYSLSALLDPVVLNIYLETLQNLSRKIDDKNIKFPNIYTLGVNTNIILNPKFSLSLDFIETYQTKLLEDNQKVNPSTILSQIGFGFTYNIDSKNAIIISTLVGTSSSAPDSISSLSLWHKF